MRDPNPGAARSAATAGARASNAAGGTGVIAALETERIASGLRFI